jgi:iron complex outermembrane receptor protein
LTLAEFNNEPKAARPAAGAFPSAVDARAAIFQKNILAGLNNQYWINSSLKNSTSIYGAFAQIKNSAIRNYERRNEPHFGGRTSMIYTRTISGNELQLIAGGEFQQGYFNTQVADNRNGNPDTLQTNDDVNLSSFTVFVQGDLNIHQKWIITAGASLNNNKVSFRRLSEYPVLNQARKYRNEFAPRISLLRMIGKNFSVLVTYSQGFSPPTIGELLPSTGAINTELQAERGRNYELTLRYALQRLGLYFEATGFNFMINDALVQRRDLSGADFFVNAGKVKQEGIELHGRYTRSLKASNSIDHFSISADYTHNRFVYEDFIKGDDDFSDNSVPSVPTGSLSLMGNVAFRNGIHASVILYTSSKIYLNDANTASADAYEVLGARVGWKLNLRKEHAINIFAGADNLFDQVYSLGNDINAAANRFYNAAPGRNYYLGISFR